MAKTKKNKLTLPTPERMRQLEFFYIADGNAKWFSYSQNRIENSLAFSYTIKCIFTV